MVCPSVCPSVCLTLEEKPDAGTAASDALITAAGVDAHLGELLPTKMMQRMPLLLKTMLRMMLWQHEERWENGIE